MSGEGGAGNENNETKKRSKNWTRSEILAGHVGGSLGQPRHDCDAGGVHSDEPTFSKEPRTLRNLLTRRRSVPVAPGVRVFREKLGRSARAGV